MINVSQVKLFFTTTEVRASTCLPSLAHNFEQNENKNATALDAADYGQRGSLDDKVDSAIVDDDYSYNDSLSDTEDEDDNDEYGDDDHFNTIYPAFEDAHL